MDAYTPFSAVGSIVAGVICLTVFFTLWGIVSKKISGDQLDVGKELQISELKDKSVNVYFKSGAKLEGVIMVGYCSTHHDAPYDFKQLLILKDKTEKRYYARISEIQHFEQVIEDILSREDNSPI